MPACARKPLPGALGQSCAEAEKLACPSGPNCALGAPAPADEATNLLNCQKAREEASVTCNSNGFLPSPPPVKGGTRETCEQYNAEVEKAKTGNKGYASNCRKAVAICLNTCVSLKKGGGSPVASATPLPMARPTGAGSAAAQFDQEIRGCQSLERDRAHQMERQMDLLAANAIKAMNCSELAGADPKDPPGGGGGGGKDTPGGGGKTDATKNAGNSNPMGGMNPMQLMSMAQQLMKQNEDPEDEMQEPEMQDCSSNPALAGCTVQTASVQSWNQPTGEAGTAKDSDEGGGISNPADIGGAQTASLGPQAGQVGTPPTFQGIANGGGQMLGGGGGGGPASLGGGGGGGGAAGGGKKVEITTGGGGGGFSQQAANMKMTNGEGGGGYNYGGRNPSGVDNGFNLSEFLPGGAKDPFKGRAIAGSMSGTNNFQIQSKEVNLFSRISERIKSRCAQGLLRDCIP